MRSIFVAAALCAFATGCTPASSEKQNYDDRVPNTGGKVKVHAPGVDVDIEKGAQKKVDVDVHPNH
jgi:predicted RNase H-like nuclease